jgi:hypothetical protein
MRVSTSFRRDSEVAEIEPVDPWRPKPSGPNTFVQKFRSNYSLPLRLVASALAIVFLLILPNPLNVRISPAPNHVAVQPNRLRRADATARCPPTEGYVMNTSSLSGFLRGVGSHYA